MYLEDVHTGEWHFEDVNSTQSGFPYNESKPNLVNFLFFGDISGGCINFLIFNVRKC